MNKPYHERTVGDWSFEQVHRFHDKEGNPGPGRDELLEDGMGHIQAAWQRIRSYMCIKYGVIIPEKDRHELLSLIEDMLADGENTVRRCTGYRRAISTATDHYPGDHIWETVAKLDKDAS